MGGEGFPLELPVRASPAAGSVKRSLSFPGTAPPGSPGPPAPPPTPPGLLLSVSLKLPSPLAEDARRRGLLAAAVGTVTWAAIAAFPPFFRAVPPPARPRPGSPSLPQARRTCLQGTVARWLGRLRALHALKPALALLSMASRGLLVWGLATSGAIPDVTGKKERV